MTTYLRFLPPPEPRPRTGAKAEAWCLLIHADASLSLSLPPSQFFPWHRAYLRLVEIMLQREIIKTDPDNADWVDTFCRVGMPFWHGPLSDTHEIRIRSHDHNQRRFIR